MTEVCACLSRLLCLIPKKPDAEQGGVAPSLCAHILTHLQQARRAQHMLAAYTSLPVAMPCVLPGEMAFVERNSEFRYPFVSKWPQETVRSRRALVMCAAAFAGAGAGTSDRVRRSQ